MCLQIEIYHKFQKQNMVYTEINKSVNKRIIITARTY